MKPDVDRELIDRAKKGDADSMEALIGRYQDRIHALACRQLGLSGAEDVTQDIFLKVLEKLPGFRGESSFSTWLYAMTLNHCRDEARKNRTRGCYSLDQGLGGPDETPLKDRLRDRVPGPEQQLIINEELGRLERALGRLDPDTREILLMRDMQQLPYHTIASVVGVPEGTVKSRLHYGRKKLGELLRKARL